jgi:hypothetical protein
MVNNVVADMGTDQASKVNKFLYTNLFRDFSKIKQRDQVSKHH